MKKRILSAGAGLAVLAVVLVFFDTILVNVLAAVVCLLALYEIFKAAQLLRFRMLAAVCGVYCVLILFLNTDAISISFSYLSYLLVVMLFLMLLRDHRVLRVEQVAYSFLMSILLAVSFYCLILLKEKVGPQQGVFYLLMIFGSAWWSDSGAYFTGTFFGKRKLCPLVSPKKTVEGLIGGVITAAVCNAGGAALPDLLQLGGPLGVYPQRRHHKHPGGAAGHPRCRPAGGAGGPFRLHH